MPKEPPAELGPDETLNGVSDCYISPDPIHIGASDAEDRKIEQGNPGEHTQGQTQGETPPPAGAGDWQAVTLPHNLRCRPAASHLSPSCRAGLQNLSTSGEVFGWLLPADFGYVFELREAVEQWHHSGLFDKLHCLLGRYPRQLPFAFLGPFFDLLFDLEEEDLNCRGACLS